MFVLEIIKRLLVSIPSLYVARGVFGESHERGVNDSFVLLDKTPLGVIVGEGIPAAIVIALIVYWFSVLNYLHGGKAT